MEITDLMVGDWASVSGKPVKITKDDLATMLIFLDDDSKIDPIPLTKEILVKFGFFVTTDQYNQEVWKMKGHELVVVESGFYIHLFGAMCRVDYLHQLQQLIRIMDIDKEIEL